MTPKEFARYTARDIYCLHCGEDEAIAPQHRINRGMGGKHSKADKPSNIIVLCSFANGLAESNAAFARICRDNGWKLHSWADPLATPVLDAVSGIWWYLDDTYNRRRVF